MKKFIFSILATIVISIAASAQVENNSISVTYLGHSDGYHKFAVKNKMPFTVRINFYYTTNLGWGYSTSRLPIAAGGTYVVWTSGSPTNTVRLTVNVREKVTPTTDISSVTCISN